MEQKQRLFKQKVNVMLGFNRLRTVQKAIFGIEGTI